MTLFQSSAGIIVVQRGRDFLGDAGALRGEEAFGGQRLDALDHHAADHFQRGGGADFVGRDRAAHVEFVDQQRQHGLRMRAGEQQRRLVRLGMDRREDRDVDVARGAAESLRGFLLAARRDRIDVEKIGIARNMRRDRLRGIETRAGGHRRNDDVGVRDRIGRRGGEPRADRSRRACLSLRPRPPETECPRRRCCSTPASRKPEAIACPASPKPMKQRRGLLLLMLRSLR